MSQRFDLNIEARETGKANSRALRVSRKVPAVVYGSVEPQNIVIDEGSIIRYNVRAYENALFSLKSKDSKLNNIVVSMSKKKGVLNLEGKPIGLAEGGLLNVVNRQLDIECLPTEIPESISADISNLGVGDALHVADLQVPKGIKVMSPAEQTVAVVNLFVEEAIAAPVAAAAATPAAGAPAAGAAAAGAKKEGKK